MPVAQADRDLADVFQHGPNAWGDLGGAARVHAVSLFGPDGSIAD